MVIPDGPKEYEYFVELHSIVGKIRALQDGQCFILSIHYLQNCCAWIMYVQVAFSTLIQQRVVWSLNDWCKLPLTVPDFYEIHLRFPSKVIPDKIDYANHITYNNTLIRSYINFTSLLITLQLTLKLMSWLIIRNLFNTKAIKQLKYKNKIWPK